MDQKKIKKSLKKNRALILSVLDIFQTALITLIIYVFIFHFIAQPLRVVSISMQPNYYENDRVLAEKISYRFSVPKRGDVVVVAFPDNPDLHLIKRVIGLPGEEIMIIDSEVYINGTLLSEPYILEQGKTIPNLELPEKKPLKLKNNEYFVMGDNREKSADSRIWGPTEEDDIIGNVILRYWPLSKISTATYQR